MNLPDLDSLDWGVMADKDLANVRGQDKTFVCFTRREVAHTNERTIVSPPTDAAVPTME